MLTIGNQYTTKSAYEIADIAATSGFTVIGVDSGIRYCGVAQYRCFLDGTDKRIHSCVYGVTSSYDEMRDSVISAAKHRHGKSSSYAVEYDGVLWHTDSDDNTGFGYVQSGFDATTLTEPAAQMVVDAIESDLGKTPPILCVEKSTPAAVESVNQLLSEGREEHLTGGAQWTFSVTPAEAKSAVTGDTFASKYELLKTLRRRQYKAARTPGHPSELHRFATLDESDACGVALACGAELRQMFQDILSGDENELVPVLWSQYDSQSVSRP